MSDKKKKQHQATSGMVVDDGWDPNRPHGHYPTQHAMAPCDDGKRGYRKPTYDPELDSDRDLRGLRKVVREKRLFE